MPNFIIKYCGVCFYDYYFVVKTSILPFVAPSSPPSNLSIIATTISSITVEWAEVPCEDRNGIIKHYQWRIALTTDITVTDEGTVNVTTLHRVFTGLIPRSNYTIDVRALDNFLMPGPPAVITAVTSTPSGNSLLYCLAMGYNTGTLIGLGFLLAGIAHSNNSVVALRDIGQTAPVSVGALYCLTNSTRCCREKDGRAAGEWFLPGQSSPVVGMKSNAENFTRARAPSAVLLNHWTTIGPSGVYTCQILDASGQLRTLYIGVDTGTIM